MITHTHTRLLKCALEIEDSRSYWRHRGPDAAPPSASQVLSEMWFGPKSLPRITVLLQNFRHRYDAYPDALAALHAWSEHPSLAEASPLVCHWHTLATDPLYRAFVRFLTERRLNNPSNPTITRTVTLAFVDAYPDAAPWSTATKVQFASKLLSAAYAAGLVTSNQDHAPRPLAVPRVSDEALAYALHIAPLFGLDRLDNDLLRPLDLSLDDGSLDHRLRRLTSFTFTRAGQLTDVSPTVDLATWAHNP